MKKNKIISILLSLVAAICLWIYVVNTVTPDDSQWIYNIPVTFANEDGLFSDRNLTLIEGRDATVSLRFNGKRQDLLRLNSTNILVTVDLSQVTEPGDWHLAYDYELPETVTSSEMSLEGRSSATVDIVVDRLSIREVEVQGVFQGDVAEGYAPEPIKLEYESIEIRGPKDLVNSVDHAEVVLERTNLSKAVSDVLSYTLVDEEGNPVESDEIKCSVDKIGVEMPVFMVKEVPLRVDLIAGGGASEDHAIVKIEPSSVMIKGNPEELETMNSLTIDRIDLATVQKKEVRNVDIVIPNGMTNHTGDTATVTVELRNLKTRTFQVTNIEYSNKPTDYSVTLGTSSLQVQIRGLEESINELTASSIRAVVDLTTISSSTGSFFLPVEIYVDGFTDVGAMGTYNVLVTISENVTTAAPVEVSEASGAAE